jgi:F-type H+-transporting ATPase subunit b
MDATLHALGEILLRAVPTFLLVIALHFYLKFMFFKPLEKTLHKRYEATEGARKRAEQSLERAAQRTTEYEAAIRSAKGEVYQAQERVHRELQEHHAAQIAQARDQAETLIQKAKTELDGEVAAARSSLERESGTLAARIADTILERSRA